MDLGKVGIWSGRLTRRPTLEALDLSAEWEQLGYGALWVPESPGGKDVLTFAAILLGATDRMVLATGIAIVWARDPTAMMNAGRTLADAHPGRFLLGLGVSHESTALARGHEYHRPLSTMRAYLQAMDEASFDGHPTTPTAPRVIAALGPKMIALGGELADGVHPFLSSPDHTFEARRILGPGKLIAVELGVVLETDRRRARDAARANLERFLRWPNYRNHFQRLGYEDSDLAGGGDDRLIDHIYALGDVEAIRGRVAEHIEAGADHVCLQIIAGGQEEGAALRELAPGLLSL